MLTLLAGATLPAMAQTDIVDTVAYKDQKVDIGANRLFTREQSTAAVTVITNKDVNKRGARNIGNNILGSGSGLIGLDGTGLYHAQNPTFYIRGIQTSSSSTPLVIVDGVERAIENVAAEDVESVQILKDAAATALYGYKGANGVLLVTTKHGKYNTKSFNFSYDHVFSYLTNKPKMVDAATYASAVNEAYHNQGSTSDAYGADVIEAYRNGSNPLYYPNVNWADETFRNVAHNNRFNLEFKGGTTNFRYYTNIQLLTNKGFIKNYQNDGYSTQNKYTRGTLRSNMDIDLGAKTKLHTHLYGLLTEQSQPGDQADLWTMIYKVPANAFPIKVTDHVWGGNTVYTTSNPVAQSQGCAYYKNHQRALYADLQLDQDLSAITEGLSAQAQIGYDTWSNVYENHSKTYRYSYYETSNAGPVVEAGTATLSAVQNTDSNMGTASGNDAWIRRCIFNASINYDKTIGTKHKVYGQLKYDYEYNDKTGTNTTTYRHNISLFGHYGYDNRYLLDVALVESASNRMAPGTKWAFSPNVSAAWNLSNEAFLKDVKWVDFLKLRASWGNKSLDVLPGSDAVWTYYDQFYLMNASTYPFDATYTGTQWVNTYLSTARTQSLGHEKSSKFNVGIDATLFGGLNVSADYYYQHRYDIWYSTAGSYSSVFGLTAPYENVGVINSQGFEFSADYSKKLSKDLTINVGASITLNKTIVEEQAEAPQLYANTSSTGKRYGQAFGYVANGFFQKSDDLDGDGIISVAEMKQLGYPVQSSTTIYPGDVKYVDITEDGTIDSNDRQAIGYSTTAPDIYYNFHLGAEYKGLGIDAMFQGTGRWTGFKTTNGLYRSAVATNTLSQYLYENSWSSERGNTENPLFPRLSTTSNANNDVNSTLNMFDRSYLKLRYVEIYYSLPQALLKHTGCINNVKVYVRGTDLFTADHLDKADAAAYGTTQPLTRSVQVGAAVTF